MKKYVKSFYVTLYIKAQKRARFHVFLSHYIIVHNWYMYICIPNSTGSA